VSKLRVAVLYGGRTGEHEVSLNSAESIIKAMDPAKYDVQRILISNTGRWQPRAISPEPGGNPDIDVVFPVLHGTFGEDGTVQGLLELADLPYVGAGVLASSVSMDKEVQKRLCVASGLPVVEHMVVPRPSEEMLGQSTGVAMFAKPAFGFPMFVKPANLGSSVGISKVKSVEELLEGIRIAGLFDRKIIIERGIIGREFECSVLGNEDPRASVPCEILPSRDFYDYEDKYLLNKAQTVVPADLTPEQTKEIQELAVACYRAVACEGMARVDFLLETATGKFFINEINTIPGFTSISMFPKMWEASGLAYPALIDRLIELAIERHEARRATRYSR
jgi:D-alanine-D-alanine ligase